MLSIKLILAYFRRRKLRTILTTLTVAVAVAALVAIRGLTGSMAYTTGQLAGLLGGKAQLEVQGPQGGMPATLLGPVRETAGVQNALPFIMSGAQIPGLPGFVPIMGIVPGEDEKIRSYTLAAGRLPLSGERGIAVPGELLRGKAWRLGDAWPIQTLEGMQTFTLTGVLADKGVALVNGGAIVFMPLDVAQKVFGLEGKISSISVVLRNPNQLAAVQNSLQKSMGAGFQVRPPLAPGRGMDQMLDVIAATYNTIGFLGLFLALFVLYNSMSVAVSEQESQIGTLRSLGWRRREIRRLIATQALLLGLLGSSLGLLLGTYLAQILLNSVGEFLREIGRIFIPYIHLTGLDYGLTWAAGVLSCVVSAWLPARKASAVSPVEAMNGQYAAGERGYTLRRGIGLVMIVASWATVCYVKSMFSWQAALALLLVGTAILTPPLYLFFLKGLEPWAARLFGLTGSLGVGSFRRAPRRTVITGMPILLGLAVVFGFSGVLASYNQTLAGWIKQQVSPDIVISQGFRTGSGNDLALPGELLNRVRKVSGVREAAGTRAGGFLWHGRPIDLAMFDVGEWRKFTSPPILQPGKEEALAALQAGGQIWVSQSLALRYGMGIGDKLAIPTPSGTVNFPIAAITRDFFSYNGTVHMNRQDYIRYWRDDSLDYIYVTVEPGVAPGLVKERLAEDLQKDYPVTVSLASDFQESMFKIIDSADSTFKLVFIVVLLVVAAATLNSLLIAVLERKREFGALRALGFQGGQLRGMILIEAGSLLFAGIFFSIPVALSIEAFGIIFYKNALGWVLDVHMPWALYLGAILVMILVVGLSAFYPARLASKVNPVEALRSE